MELIRTGALVAFKAASFDIIRTTVLQTAGPGDHFLTIHSMTFTEYCEATGTKIVYKKVRSGAISSVAGVTRYMKFLNLRA